ARRWSIGASAGETSCACAEASAIRSLNQYATPFMTTPRSRKVTVPASPKSSLPMSTSRTVRATKRKAVFSWFILRLFPGGGAVNRLPRRRFGLVLGEAADPRLVGDAQLVHGVVVGVGDVVAALRIERRHVEVEQVAVRKSGRAEDPEVADVPHMHCGGGDLGDRPRRTEGSSDQVYRLRGVEVPGTRPDCIRHGGAARAAPREELAQGISRLDEWSAEVTDYHLARIAGGDRREQVRASLARRAHAISGRGAAGKRASAAIPRSAAVIGPDEVGVVLAIGRGLQRGARFGRACRIGVQVDGEADVRIALVVDREGDKGCRCVVAYARVECLLRGPRDSIVIRV